MQNEKTCESFPVWIPVLSIVLSLSIYLIVFYIFLQLWIIFAALFVLYCLWIEMKILRHSCVDCFYYGKTCGLGRGKICSLIFRKGDPKKIYRKRNFMEGLDS